MPKRFWEIAGLLVEIISIFGAYDIFFRSEDKKHLDIFVEKRINLFDNKDTTFYDDIKIFYKDKPAKNVSILTIRVRNTGNQPIIESDFNKELVFNFDTTKIVNALISKVNPTNVKVKIEQTDPNEIRIKPSLLNPNDEFVV